jgi:predicted aldo/keto reductase-like oxidoreductase
MKEVDQVTKKDGALEALTEMRDQGVVKYLGFTGHEDPNVLVEMSKRFDFDTVLCPINAGDPNIKPSFIETMLPVAKKQKLGIIGMKVFAQGYI